MKAAIVVITIQHSRKKCGTPYFIIAGLIVDASKWKTSLEKFKTFRKKIAHEAYLPYHIEFHCSEMIDPHKIKEFTSISVKDRWKLIEDYSEVIGNNADFSIITVVIDKRNSALDPNEYLTSSITKLYQAFDDFLKKENNTGILFFDRANEKHVNTHVRRLLGTGASGETIPHVRIRNVIEDPIFRISHDSIFIQSADVIAFTLKEMEFPQSARKKFSADKIYMKKLSRVTYKSQFGDRDGIIRL